MAEIEGATGLSNPDNRLFWRNNLAVNHLYMEVRPMSPEQLQASRNFVAAMIVSARREAARVPAGHALYRDEDFAQQRAYQNPIASS